MHTTCVNSKDNAKSNDSDLIFVIRENTHLKHRCPLFSSEVLVYRYTKQILDYPISSTVRIGE